MNKQSKQSKTSELNCGPCFRERSGVVFGCTRHSQETQHSCRHGVIEISCAKCRKNRARRERHQAMLDLGLRRVKGALGGVYYE